MTNQTNITKSIRNIKRQDVGIGSGELRIPQLLQDDLPLRMIKATALVINNVSGW